MSTRIATEPYPAEEHGVIDLGDRHFALPLSTGGYLWWHDCPLSHSWSWFGQGVRGQASGHTIISRDPLTVGGSLLCPMRCGAHGFIRDGVWVNA